MFHSLNGMYHDMDTPLHAVLDPNHFPNIWRLQIVSVHRAKQTVLL